MASQSTRRAGSPKHSDGEIALAWIIWKYATRGVDCNPKKIPTWLERRSRHTGISVASLFFFLLQVIVPAIFKQGMNWRDDDVATKEFEIVALKLASFELHRDENELKDQAASFQKHGLSLFSMDEVLSFMTRHIIEPAKKRKEEAAALAKALAKNKA